MTEGYDDHAVEEATGEAGIGLNAGVSGTDETGFSPSAGSAVTRMMGGVSDAGMAAGRSAGDEIGLRGDAGNEGSAGDEWNDSGLTRNSDDAGMYAIGAGTSPGTGGPTGGGPDAAERDELGMGGGTDGYLDGGEGDEGA